MSLKLQGLVFSAAAWLVVGATLWLPPLDSQSQLALMSPIILLLGVPHGALDIVFVQQRTGIRSAAGWSLFTIAYLAAASLVVILWWASPGVFLVAFLIASALHFSGDPEGKTPLAMRLLYGGAFIFCPLTLHAAEVEQLFAFLAGGPAAQTIVVALQWAAWPWVAAMGAAAMVSASRALPRSIELVSLAAMLTVAPPLIGFTLFFCGMHSVRHVLRTRDYASAGTWGHLVHIAAWPMAGTLVGIALAGWLSDGMSLDVRLAQLLFVGLAALTVPHMVVIEPVRFTGWAAGRSTAGSNSADGQN